MANNLTPLMFSVSIDQLDSKLKKWTEQIADFANNGGKGYKLKIDFGEAEEVINALKKLKIGDSAELQRLQNELDNVKKKLKELNEDAATKRVADGITKPLSKSADESKKVADEIEKSKKRVVEAYTDMMKSVNALQMDRAHGRGLGIDISGSQQLVQDIKAFAAEMNRLSGSSKFLGNKESVDAMIRQYNGYMQAISMVRGELAKLINTQNKAARDAAQKKIVDAKSVQEAVYQVAQLEKRLSSLRLLQQQASHSGILTPKLDTLIKDMERYISRFREIIANGGRLNDGSTTAAMVKAEGEYRALTARITQNTNETRINMAARSATIATVNLLAAEEQRLAQAITQTTTAMRGQSQVMQDLKSLAAQYFSVWGAKTILDNVIQTGGLLEQQRMSIGAILGDVSQANALFEQIKSLALRSPFGVVQLDTMSKQLTAYDFSYNEIYDWVKRIGDISAATGTEASRLALALGHVKSEGALTGYTLRQFAMGNVPLLATLAKQLGKTTSEIRKMTREKAISYDDVVVALKSMTEGDGLFANAQQTMSEALNAKFKNLRDAFDLMWGDIAESGVGDALKGLAGSLTELTKSWKPLVADLTVGAATFGALKAATLFWNTSLGQTTASTMKQALALKQQEVAQLRVAQTYRTLTTVEKIKMATASRLNAYDIRLLLNTQKLTGEELLRSVAIGKTNKQMAIAAVQTSRLDAATKQLVISQLQSLNGLRRSAIMWATFTNGIRTAATAVMGYLKSMAPLAAMMVATDAWMSKKADEDAMKDRLDSMKEKANEGFKNLVEIQKNYPVGGGRGMDNTLLSQSIDEMVEKLKDYAVTANDAFNHAFALDKEGKAVHTLSEQYDILAQALADTTEAYKQYHEMIPLIEQAMKQAEPDKNFLERMGDTMFGWLLNSNAKAANSGLSTVLQNYSLKVKEATVAENNFLRQRLDMSSALKSLGYDGVYEMENAELLRLVNTMRNTAPETFRKFYQLLSDEGKNALNGMTHAWGEMNTAFGLANVRMRKVGQDLYESMKVVWGKDMAKWPSNWREIVMIAMNNATSDVKEFADLSEDYQNMVRDSFLKPFKISVDTDEAHERVNNLLVGLQDLIGKDWTVRIGIKGEDSFADVYAAQKAYKDAQEKIKDAEARLRKLGNPIIGQANLTEQQVQTIADYNYQLERRSKARAVIESYGGTPEEPKTKKDGGSTNRKEDALAKLWQSRVEILKKYRSELEKYEKVMSREQAIDKLRKNGNFAPMFNEKWFGNPTDFIGSVDEAIRKLGTATDRRKELVARWGAEKEDFLGDKFRSDVELAVDELGRLMAVMAENYQTYKQWVDLTGDTNFAAQVAGVAQNSSMGSWLTDRMNTELKKSGSNVSASEVFTMPESEVAKFGEKSAIYKLWNEWQKIRNVVIKDDIRTFATLIGSAVDLQTQVIKINGEYQKVIERLERLKSNNKITDFQYARGIISAVANRDLKLTEASASYRLLVDGVVTMNRKAAQHVKDQYIGVLKKQLAAGAVTAKDYADKISDINKAMKKLESFPTKFRAYMQGGINGILQNQIEKGKSLQEEGAQKYQDAEMILDTSSNQEEIAKAFKDSDAAKSMMQMGEGMEAMGESGMSTVAIIDMVVHGIDNLVQGLSDAFQKIREMYTALGYDTNSDSWEDANTFFSSFSSASSSAAKGWDSLKNGDVGGVIDGVVGSFTGWITGFAKGHDKKRQNHIDALQHNIDALEANTAAIQNLRKRTLGYDLGDLRRVFYRQYQGNDAASVAMRQFYAQSMPGTGYQQELASLKAQRVAYMSMYNEESDKKESSGEALLTYQQKIAELDDQIHHFAEDVAKDLWNIDIKAWADQISDAIITAFENGESAVKAFDEAVKSIMQSVASEMLKIGIIEPMMQRLRDKLFGKNGVTTTDKLTSDPLGESRKVLTAIGEYFKPNGEGANLLTAAQEYLYGIDNLMQQMGFANGLRKEDAANTLSSGVQGTSEETSGLLAGYANSIRQDVAITRLLKESQYKEFIQNYWTDYISHISGMSRDISAISNNTATLVRMIERGEGALYEAINQIRNHFDGITNGNEQIAVK